MSTHVITNSLLPTLQKVEPQKALNLSLIISKISQNAIQALKEGRFELFDAPVGDNSCKIRAAKNANIIERSKNDPNFASEIDGFLNKLVLNQEKIQSLKEQKDLKKGLSLVDFLAKCELSQPTSPDLIFLIQSHFLFSIKKSDSYEETDPSFLQKIAPLSTSTAKDWIHTIKERLASASVEFIQQQAQMVDGKRNSILKKMVHAPFIKTYEKRPVAPNLHCMELIFLRAIDQGRFIIFKTKEKTVLFHPRGALTSWRDIDRPAMIIAGEEIAAFDFQNPIPQLLTSAAQDPQYLNGKKGELIPFDKEKEDPEVQEEMEKFNQELKQPRAFQIHHIFCDRIGNHYTPVTSWNYAEIRKSMRVNWMGDDLW